MSYFCSGNRLVRDMWPEFLSKHMDTLLEKDDLASWAVVPDTYDGMGEWAIVMPLDEGRANESTLLYGGDNTPSADGNPVRVSVVLHGIVQSVNLRALGNYKGRRGAVQRAVQYLTLGGDAWTEAFDAQLHALRCMKEYVGEVLRTTVHDAAHTEGTIHFHRPVFTPAASGLPSQLRLGDDPEGLAAGLERQWVVAHRVHTGIVDSGRAASTCIRQGDFVAVAAAVDVVKSFRGKEWRTELRLTMREVCRIMSVSQLAEYRPREVAEEAPVACASRASSHMVELTVLGMDVESDEE
ncbi:hypothetical protein OH77DRAFT_1523736 [Trametes cingulata]|nr:hypothetical protein OH77DRAFT_1523736 [Trametes cingulata]